VRTSRGVISSFPVSARTTSLARVRGVDGASVASRGGAVRIDATFTDGGRVAMSLFPSGATFAPRGAKEIRFRVEPKEIAVGVHAAELAAAVAGTIARVLFGPFARGVSDFGGAIVDREGDLLRIDLRTIPALRGATEHGPLAALFEAIEPGEIVAEDGRLRVQVRLPSALRA